MTKSPLSFSTLRPRLLPHRVQKSSRGEYGLLGRYSAFAESGLLGHLRQREADSLIVSGSETDVCVLSAVLDAVDIGYRVIVVRYMQLV
jgi:nicotinamidase-related amidase